MLCAVAAVAAISVIAYRWSMSVHARHRSVVAKSDAAMREAAATLGLEFLPGATYEHPVIGNVPSFGWMRGSIDGVPIRVKVEPEQTAHDLVRYSTELQVGTTRVVPSNIPETGSSQAYLYRLITDASALVRLVDEHRRSSD